MTSEETTVYSCSNMHITILKRGQEAPVERCTTCCSNLRYHCPFCTSEVYRPNELHHVKNHVCNHLSLAVEHEDFIIVKCNLHCREQAHFHCCYCKTTVIRKVQIIKHLTACRRRSPTPSPWPCTESTFDTEPASVREPVPSTEPASITEPVSVKELASITEPASIADPVSDVEAVCMTKIVSITKSASLAKHVHVQKKVQCTHCGSTVNKKNLDMHIRRKHSLKMHITILKKGQEAPVERCTTCCSNLRYHCPFCTSEVYRPNELHHVKNHMFNHLSLAVEHEDFIIVKCNLHCRDQAHFHCCYCTTTVIRKVQIIKHLTACRRRSPTPSPWPCTESTFDTEPASVRKPVSSTEPSSITEPVSSTEPASITKPASITEPVFVTEPASFIEPVSVTEPAFVTKPASITESASVTKPVSITEAAFVTERASIIEPASVTEPTSVTELASIPEAVSVNKLVSIAKSASLAKHVHVRKKVQCTHCGITVNKKNVDMHIRRKHSLKMHVTVLKKGQEAPVERCTTCCSNLRYHCPFCSSEVYRPNELHHVKNHVFNHLSLAVEHEDFIIVKCNLSCREQAHFHCCYCTTTVIRKVQIIKHLTACRRRSARPSPTPPPCSSKAFTFVTEPASITEQVSMTKSALIVKRVRVQKKVQCTHCGITVNKKNLDMHIRRKHSVKAQIFRHLSGFQVPLK